MYKKFNWRLLIIIVIIVVLIVAPYVLRFCGCFSGLPYCKLSPYPEYWGAFGSYFGGMVSIISIGLLYFTLQEQQNQLREQCKENYRCSFESSYNRLIKSMQRKVETNSKIFEDVYNEANKTIFDLNTKTQYWKVMNDAFNNVDDHTRNNPVVSEIYYDFSYLVYKVINSELDMGDKLLYLHDIEHSIPDTALLSILLLYCTKERDIENDLIRLLSSFEMFHDIRIVNKTLENAKDSLFRYEKYERPSFFMFIMKYNLELGKNNK